MGGGGALTLCIKSFYQLSHLSAYLMTESHSRTLDARTEAEAMKTVVLNPTCSPQLAHLVLLYSTGESFL